MIRWLATTVAVVFVRLQPVEAQPASSNPEIAQAAPRGEGACGGTLSAEGVVRCAQAASPEVATARQQLAAVAGRRATAAVLLPSNPVVAGSLSHRSRPAPEQSSALNWNVTVAQELEIAGQRGLRLDAAEAEATAARRRVVVAEQEVAAAALSALLEAAARKEAVQLADDLGKAGRALAAAVQARAAEALVAGVEADVARAEAIRLDSIALDARRRLADAESALGLLIGQERGSFTVPDLAALTPPAFASLDEATLERAALARRGDVAAAALERRMMEARLALVRRERVPNPTLSAFAERGEINDRIFGVGLSIPLPLPSPIGNTRAGEIAEMLAQLRASESSLALVQRRVRLEVSRALSALRERTSARALFDADLLSRSRAHLAALREALTARQLTVREAVTWQRSLIELLQAAIDTRLGAALAAVELRRVAGLPFFPGGAR
jgi:outer membrane protein, heavy metal efflux system